MKPLQTPGCLGAPLKFILATTAAMWMGSATAAWTPANVRQGQELRFRDFFNTGSGDGLPDVSDKLRQAAGKTVRLVGYMWDGGTEQAAGFLLAARPPTPGPQQPGSGATPAWVWVELDPAHGTLPRLGGLVEVTGVLTPGRHTSPSGHLVWAKLQLSPQAPIPASADALAGYVHPPRKRPS
ncbi:MAG: hypothetical protein CFE44_07595 [Burkholderiales bacterium PBB4]|nr:MAG: hypothetical protein CFE44_07595 [Burkholderiales bacterium PBB4]